MSAEITEFKVEISLGATVQVKTDDGAWNYVKPGAASAIKWNGLPEDGQLEAAMDYLETEVVGPILNKMLIEAKGRLEQ